MAPGGVVKGWNPQGGRLQTVPGGKAMGANPLDPQTGQQTLCNICGPPLHWAGECPFRQQGVQGKAVAKKGKPMKSGMPVGKGPSSGQSAASVASHGSKQGQKVKGKKKGKAFVKGDRLMVPIRYLAVMCMLALAFGYVDFSSNFQESPSFALEVPSQVSHALFLAAGFFLGQYTGRPPDARKRSQVMSSTSGTTKDIWCGVFWNQYL